MLLLLIIITNGRRQRSKHPHSAGSSSRVFINHKRNHLTIIATDTVENSYLEFYCKECLAQCVVIHVTRDVFRKCIPLANLITLMDDGSSDQTQVVSIE